MNSVLLDVLKIGGGFVAAALLVGIHIASVMDRRELAASNKKLQTWIERAIKEREENV